MTVRDGALLGAILGFQLLSCIYAGIFAAMFCVVFVPCLLAVTGVRRLADASIKPLMAAGIMTGLLALPYASAYMGAETPSEPAASSSSGSTAHRSRIMCQRRR